MNRLRILLINPPQILHASEKPYAVPPLGLAYLAGVLEKKFDVKILDCMVEGISRKIYVSKDIFRWGVDYEELAFRISRWEPDIVGIGCMFSSQEDVIYDVAAIYKKHAQIRDRNIIVVVGGAHASSVPWNIMKNKNIDFVVVGEGEIPFFKLCETLQESVNISGIEGIAYRDSRGNTMVNPRTKYVEDINELPLPARHLLLMDRYPIVNSYFEPKFRPFANMILTRGCNNRCMFCAVPGLYGGACSTRSAANILEELIQLKNRYNVKEIFFEDDNFLLDQELAAEVCYAIIDNELDISWSCRAGITPWGYNLELLKLMKRSGCYRVRLNGESGCEETLALIDSPSDRNILMNIIPAFQNAGIETAGEFKIGFPGETVKNIQDTFDFISRFQWEDLSVRPVMPFPGTPLWEKCNRENLLIKEIKPKDYLMESFFIKTEHFDPNSLEKLYKNGIKKLWKSNPNFLLEGVGSVLDRIVHPFTYKEKKR